MEHSDDALIARHRQGDAAAFETLYRRYAARLLGFVISLGAPRDAEAIFSRSGVFTFTPTPKVKTRR